MDRASWRRFGLAALALGVALAFGAVDLGLLPLDSAAPEPADVRPAAPSPARSGDDEIVALFTAGRSGEIVEGRGTVVAVLPDDREGSRHQRFLLALASGHTLLVSHNVDLAPRVESLRRGDRVEFRGQYEWNEEGGVVHWTHHDPDGRREGGWLRRRGEEYR